MSQNVLVSNAKGRTEDKQIHHSGINILAQLAQVTSFMWGERDGTLLTNDFNKAYEIIVFWRKSLFKSPMRHEGKKNIKEITLLLNAWTHYTPLRSISLKAVDTMPV